MLWIVWLIALVTAVAVEAATTNLVAIWFLPAAIVAMIVSFFDVPFYVQALIFVVLGLVLILASRPLARRLTAKRTNTNADSLVGREALVTEEICNLKETGEVRVAGLYWSARAADDKLTIPKDTTVTVESIEGVKLIVRMDTSARTP